MLLFKKNQNLLKLASLPFSLLIPHVLLQFLLPSVGVLLNANALYPAGFWHFAGSLLFVGVLPIVVKCS